MYIHAGGIIIVEVNWLLKYYYYSHCVDSKKKKSGQFESDTVQVPP